METYSILKSGLVLHITGVVMMVGCLLAVFVAYQQFWKLHTNENDKAEIIFKVISRFQVLQMVGGLLILTGGIMMMFAFHGVIMHTMWFKIKMVMLLLIIMNAVLIARPAGVKLKKLIIIRKTGIATEQYELNRCETKNNAFFLSSICVFHNHIYSQHFPV